jgi:hypothetical protein
MRARVARALIPLAAAFAVPPATAAAGTVAPTAFERFATHPDSVVVASREVGSLRSVDSTVTVTVLVVAMRADPSQRMRGARFELRNNGGIEQIYLDDRQFTKLESDVGLMELGDAAAARRGERTARGNSVTGTEACWMPNPMQRILCPELQRASTWTGLRLWTFGGATFDFREGNVADLRELVERAVTELNEL